jgi:hypothetical protein
MSILSMMKRTAAAHILKLLTNHILYPARQKCLLLQKVGQRERELCTVEVLTVEVLPRETPDGRGCGKGYILP